MIDMRKWRGIRDVRYECDMSGWSSIWYVRDVGDDPKALRALWEEYESYIDHCRTLHDVYGYLPWKG